MNSKQLFKKYYSRLAWEGLIKALILGFTAGFFAGLVSAFITFMVNESGLLLAIVVVFGVALASTPLFYHKMFRPKTKQIAQRVDRLGLEERLVTMLELEKDESYIAMRQREDAKAKLGSVNHKRLKFSVFKIPIIALVVLAACSTTMITVSAVSVDPKIAWIDPGSRPEVRQDYVKVSYRVDDSNGFTGGYISGYADQLVAVVYPTDDNGDYLKNINDEVIVIGQDATTVKAIADDGYKFSAWSDGLKTPERTDKKILDTELKGREEIVFYAIFVEYDEPPELPPNSGERGSGPGNITFEDDEREKYINQMVDEAQYYGDLMDEYHATVMSELSADGDTSSSMLAIIEAYYRYLLTL